MNEAFDKDLSIWVYADGRYDRRPDALFFPRNDNHHHLSVSDINTRPVGYRTTTLKRRAHFYLITHTKRKAAGGNSMSYEHRRGRDVLFERLLKKDIIQIGLKSEYRCEFDTICGHCFRTLSPKKLIFDLCYYDQVFCEQKSFLFPSFQPDILLRNSISGEELWIEINTEHSVRETPEKIYTGIPIFERDCSDNTDIEYISRLTTMYDGNHCRIYNAWNLPVYKGVGITCDDYLMKYDRRKYGYVKMYLHPDGRKIPTVKGDYGMIPIINGRWRTIKEVTQQGYNLQDVEISEI